MNVKTHPINPMDTGTQRKPFRLFLLSSLTGIGLLSLTLASLNNDAAKQVEPAAIPAIAPSTYDIESLKITDSNSGTAVIKLDDFLLTVPFSFEAHQDSYGVPGSDFLAVDVDGIGEIKITDQSGTSFRDFTNHNDIYNIRMLIATYIEKNKLAEGA